MLRQFAQYIGAQERRLAFQSIVIGTVIWVVVTPLKTAVPDVSHLTFHDLKSMEELYWTLFERFSLLLSGAVFVAPTGRYANHVIHYRDDSGHSHKLIDSERDNLKYAMLITTAQ